MRKLPAQTYENKKSRKDGFESLRAKIKLKHLEARRKLFHKYPHVERFFQEKGIDVGKIREHSAKLIGAGAIAGALLLVPPDTPKSLPSPHEIIEKMKLKKLDIAKKEYTLGKVKETSNNDLVEIFKRILPSNPRPLAREEEKILEQIFHEILGIPARASLEGEHLNTTYGFIGAEQHLRRFPGDNIRLHSSENALKEGMALGLGAWGYLARSRKDLTKELKEIEKWYAAVQTFYLPDWKKRQPYLKDWYKYRKVLIVNTQNGKAVIAAIADSGPAAWTGKHFGGSPEVMYYLGGTEYKKGPVILFFVDDPENKIPLGPVVYNWVN